MTRTVSVVINTYNRGASLRVTLESLGRLSYPSFEVIVVNGPSTDGTDAVLTDFAHRIKVERCKKINLAASRNIGLKAAAGELVAFLDDDTIPYEYWLNDLVPHFNADEVAGAGGFVFDHDGFNFQHRYRVMNRMGSLSVDLEKEPDAYCYPESALTPYMLGTNAVFRRDICMKLGGFDEEYDYYLEETDLCTRMIDAGYLLKQRACGFVSHRRLASHNRNQHGVFMNWYSILKNQVYYSIRNRIDDNCSTDAIVRASEERVVQIEAELRQNVAAGLLDASQLECFRSNAAAGIEAGVRDATGGPRRLIDAASTNSRSFKRHPYVEKANRQTICMILPEGVLPMKARIEALLDKGAIVHVIASTAGPNQVVYEAGVWMHQLQFETGQWDQRALEELERMRKLYRIDSVQRAEDASMRAR
jgi:glycogen(starch) synthase